MGVVTAVPADPGDIHCDTCSNRHADRGTGYRTRESARVAGWHIHQEPDLTWRILCPTCIGTPRTRLPVVEVMKDQGDLLEDLDVTLTQVPKVIKKRGSGGREMS